MAGQRYQGLFEAATGSEAAFTVVDLTQPLGAATPAWPGASRVSHPALATIERDGFFDRDLRLPEHVGTHLDAPAHFVADAATVDQLAASALVRPLRVVDVRALVGDDRNHRVTADAVRAAEAAHGTFAPGCVAAFCTGWDRYVDDAERYAGPYDGPPRFPGLAVGVASLLIERGVTGVAIDTLGVDPGCDRRYPFHLRSLAAGLWHLEGVVNLHRVPAVGAWIVAGVIPVTGGSGAPARALALVPTAT